ncbi:MAG: hypothetical protein PHH06_00405 [Candidatus Gracilibacteria bacterium]|nr:hypothetical protein [Candidatus Gracilibacteria bacterium]
MFDSIYDNIISTLISNVELYISEYGVKIFWALIILVLGVVVSVLVYRFVMFLFAKFKIVELIEKLEIDIYEENEKVIGENKKDLKKAKTKTSGIFNKKIRVNHIVAKAVSYYVFLLFFRWAVVKLGVTEVEQFLKDVLYYLPSLFVGIIIGYFGIRFANFVYDITFHALSLAKQQAARIIASGAKIIILFFTLMVVLNYTKIVDQFIINTILVGFISMLTIAGGLAFGLGGRDIAKEILESFRK